MPQPQSGNRICRRYCIRVEGELVSPLLVGSGEEDITDIDAAVDEEGVPFIPGSGLAGALREYMEETESMETAKSFFGASRSHGTLGDDTRQSRLFVYDTQLLSAGLQPRDGVRLDEYKTGADKAKYQMQIVGRGTAYVMRMELVEREEDAAQEEIQEESRKKGIEQVHELIAGLDRGDIVLGARSRRGFGRLRVNAVRMREFDMTKREEHLAWLEWDWMKEDAFIGIVPLDMQQLKSKKSKKYHCLHVPLQVRKTLLIRTYPIQDAEDRMPPDYAQLLSGGQAVIPGTSWMGAIRRRLVQLLQGMMEDNQENREPKAQKILEYFFGSWNATKEGNQSLLASRVEAEESVLHSGYRLPLTRNAIDRFTGGALNGALYTGAPWVGGRTGLVLRWPRNLDKELHAVLCGLLLWTAADLQEGLLGVGGETAVGRGTFAADGEITLDGNPIQTEDRLRYCKAAMAWCRQEFGKEGGEG